MMAYIQADYLPLTAWEHSADKIDAETPKLISRPIESNTRERRHLNFSQRDTSTANPFEAGYHFNDKKVVKSGNHAYH
ncbi:hypothetical protein Tco_0423564, partial [Tanacetum coccineum]